MISCYSFNHVSYQNHSFSPESRTRRLFPESEARFFPKSIISLKFVVQELVLIERVIKMRYNRTVVAAAEGMMNTSPNLSPLPTLECGSIYGYHRRIASRHNERSIETKHVFQSIDGVIERPRGLSAYASTFYRILESELPN